jgi:hypothetical protein
MDLSLGLFFATVVEMGTIVITSQLFVLAVVLLVYHIKLDTLSALIIIVYAA